METGVYIHICPYCLSPVLCYSKDYLDGHVKPVRVDLENKECHVLLGRDVYKNASCSNVQKLRIRAGAILKRVEELLGVSFDESKRKEYLSKVVELRKNNRYWPDWKVLEIAINSVLGYALEGG
ncbi:conserved hypothetical protein [Methanocaldococcus sp. FS406-22]|uniref:hypothetical protein n=1 Tax=Methanocaldococcus sp. (strain FS406-22) TaxID=644281 RepID=UPI0001BF34F2|nr:hypothetical protein [Methanocaldococcus sp. FS406-22]ADC69822.1 conserved hypothetical protein [Methanocaldococcus sp. FS406-22]